MTGTSSLGGNTRWMPIELFNPSVYKDSSRNHEVHTKRSDVWAFGMVVYVSDNLGFNSFIDHTNLGDPSKRSTIQGIE